MTTPVSNITRTNLNLLDPNLAINQIADPALRKACFDEIYTYLDTFVTAYNAFIAAGGIATGNLADGAVTSLKIADGTIVNADVNAAAAIDASKLANLSITSAQIADGTIMNVDINTSAAIDASKIGAGLVSNTEFGYLDGLTGNIQTQINGVVLGSIPDDSLDYVKLNAATIGLLTESAMSRQALINGNFDIPQRGTSFTNPTDSQYTLDRWKARFSVDGGTGPTVNHSQLLLTSGDVAGAYFGYRINTTGAGASLGANSLAGIQQHIENGVRYLCGSGKKVTLSFWAKSDIVGKKIGVFLQQNYGSSGSPSTQEQINGTNWTLTSSWTKYTYTFTTNTLGGKTFGTSKDDSLILQIRNVWGSSQAALVGASVAETFVGAGNIDIAQVQVNAGDTALPFQPKDVGDETNKSLRFAWIPQSNSVYVRATTFTANTLVFDITLPVQLRTTPTIRGTVNTDILAYTVAGVAQTGFTASVVLTSSGARVTMTKTTHGLTDAYLEIKTTSGFDAEI